MKSTDVTTKTVVIGNKTEGALIIFAKEMGSDYMPFRKALVEGDNAEGAVAYKVDFSSERKRMTYVLDNAKFN